MGQLTFWLGNSLPIAYIYPPINSGPRGVPFGAFFSLDKILSLYYSTDTIV
jgi:hypothetical protein